MRRVSASGEALYDKQGNKLDRFRDTTSSNLLSNYLLSVCVCVCVCVWRVERSVCAILGNILSRQKMDVAFIWVPTNEINPCLA